MTDEPKKQKDEIQGILSELESILSGLGGSSDLSPKAAAPAPKAPEPAAPPAAKPAAIPKPAAPEPPKPAAPAEPLKLAVSAKPVEIPKPAEPAKPVEAPKPAAPSEPLKLSVAAKPVELPKPVEAAKPVELPKPVEAPKPVEPPKAVEPVKPAAPPKPVEAPKAAEAPKPPAAAKPAEPPPPAAPAAPAAEDIPGGALKDQIRRVAYVHTASCAEARASFATFLSQAARTISKKPLYLRQVLALELTAGSDPLAVFEKAREAKAVAVLAVADGWPPAKVDALSEACARGGMLFMSIAPGDVQKKATAVDVIVDMMLLSGEA
jgi:hypothetical protein